MPMNHIEELVRARLDNGLHISDHDIIKLLAHIQAQGEMIEEMTGQVSVMEHLPRQGEPGSMLHERTDAIRQAFKLTSLAFAKLREKNKV